MKVAEKSGNEKLGNEKLKDEKLKDKKLKDKKIWEKIFLFSSKYKYELIASAALSLPEAFVNIIGPKLSGKLMNALSEGAASAMSGGSMNFEYILKLLTFLFTMYSFFLGCSCVSSYLISNASISLTYKMRKEISEKIDRLSLRYFNKETYGEVISRITNDVELLVSTLTQSLSQIISSVVMLVGIVYMMISISLQMTFVSFLGTPIGLFFVFLLVNFTQKYFKDYRIQLGKMNGHIEEMYFGHSVVKAFSGEKVSIEKFNKLNEKMYNLEWKANFLSSFVSPIMEFMSSLTYVILCVIGGHLAISGGISIGDIFAFLNYSNQFMKPLSSVTGISGTIQQLFSAAQRVFEFLEEDEIPEDEIDSLEITKDGDIKDLNGETFKINGEVEFKNLMFTYGSGNFAIKNFSLKVETGKNIAIVGPTGAGKTTVTKLLTGFYPIQSGKILIDGYDIRKFKRKDLFSLFGVVFQDSWMFRGTIMENIRYGKIGSSDEEVKNAAKLACADGFINSLPEGYETVINESSDNISQGEKQLITIARAILAKRKILILDEATASVDTRTEALLQKGLKALMQGMTSFIVAHRLSTIRYADKIIVMNDGEIFEQGTHEELMQKKGLYHKMYVLQFKNGFLE